MSRSTHSKGERKHVRDQKAAERRKPVAKPTVAKPTMVASPAAKLAPRVVQMTTCYAYRQDIGETCYGRGPVGGACTSCGATL